MYPLSDMVWAVFSGELSTVFSPIGSFAKRGIPQLVFVRPIGLVYFLVGAEVGIA
jgi:hypothetical protein